MDLDHIRWKFLRQQYSISFTHTEKLRRRRISSGMIEQTIATGEIIETYPDDPRGPSCLILGYPQAGRPLHVVCGNFDQDELLVITAYEPSPEQWERDWRTRKGIRP
jgi:hypothetical protein